MWRVWRGGCGGEGVGGCGEVVEARGECGGEGRGTMSDVHFVWVCGRGV